MIPSGKTLYDSMFSDGDFVFIITDDDKLDHGYLFTEWDGSTITLSMPGRKPRGYSLDEIRFMAHDGLPIKQIRMPWHFVPNGTVRWKKNIAEAAKKAVRPRSFTMGDPWEIEDIVGIYGVEDEPHLALYHPNGACGLLWHLQSVWNVELWSGEVINKIEGHYNECEN